MRQTLGFLILSLFTSQSLATVTFQGYADEGLFVCNAGIDQSHSIEPMGSSSLVVEFDDLNTDPDSLVRSRRLTRQTSVSNPVIWAFDSISIWNQNIRKLEFNFSLEKYDARYFVDFCYQGPVQVLSGPKDLTWGNYQIDIESFFSGSNSYTIDSRLKVNTQVLCDLRNQGLESNARTTQELGPNVLPLESDINMLGEWLSSGSRATSFSRGLNQGIKDVPRFCVIRLSFAENNSLQQRNNTTQSEVTVDVSINRN